MLVLALTLVGVFFLLDFTPAFAKASAGFAGSAPILAQASNPAAQNYGLTPGEGFGQVAIGQTGDLYGTIARVINIAFGFLGIIAVILVIYAGFLWMTAHGNEDQVKKAKLILRNAVIGLVIILSAWGIAAFVISRLSNATGGGGGVGAACSSDANSCVPDSSFCASGLFCSPSSCTCQSSGGGGGVGGEQFTLQEFQTGHVGPTNRDDVYLCSAAQSRFNQWLNAQSVVLARGRKELKVLQTHTRDSSGAYVASVVPVEVGVNIDHSNNVVQFGLDRDKKDVNIADTWPTNSQLEIQVPKTITSDSAEPEALADCTALGCNDRDSYYAWSFTTTDKTDAIPPALTSAFPRLPGSPEGYPDRDVDRSITFTLNFSEAIDYFSIIRSSDHRLEPDHVKVEQITYSADQTVVAAVPIPTEDFDASLSETGVRFALNRSHQSASGDGPYLEPFTWYRITAKDITDLCGNPLVATGGNEVVWIFQTNGNVPGVAFTYPSDGYQYACQNTETFVQFRTSMYDVKNSSCVVNPTAGGLVLSGSGLAGRNLSVHDNLPTTGLVNPNNFCKRYDFAPPPAELAPNTTYNPSVAYRNPANDSQTASSTWRFMVKPANECADAPYINRIDPGQGPFGRCLTIQGNYFGIAKLPADDAFMTLDLESARNAIAADAAGQAIRGAWTTLNNSGGIPAAISPSNWLDTYLTGVVPKPDGTEAQPLPPGTGGLADFKFSVTKNITLGGQPQVLKSNEVNFTAELVGSYNGPCLSTINPSSGAWQTPVTLAGTNFGASQATDSFVKFNNNTLQASIDNWQSTRIQTSVPNNTGDKQLVHVTTAQGLSNGLPFDVANGRGSACQDSSTCSPPLVCLGGICTDPPAPGRPAGFRVEDNWPATGCANACDNALVGFATNFEINKNTLNSLALLKCKDEGCKSFVTGLSETINPTLNTEAKQVNLGSTLVSNTRYRVIVPGNDNGLRSTDSKNLVTLNYDSNNDGQADAFSWYFTTGPNACVLSRIEINKPSLALYENDSSSLEARPFSRPDSCSPNDGQPLDPMKMSFNWKACAFKNGDINKECATDCSAPVIGSEPVLIVNSSSTFQNMVTAKKGTTAGTNGLACVFASGQAVKDGSVVTVRARCREDRDCSQGNSCPGSICNKTGVNAGHCTPIITAAIAPNNGRAGTWVTVNGCYFGNRAGIVTSATSNKPFEIPAAMCGQVWNDTSIITETPAALMAVEAIKITKHASEDGQSAVSSNNFTPNETVYPALCRVRPDYGGSGDETQLFGKNFGVYSSTTDKVIFDPDGSAVGALPIRQWIDNATSTMITLVVPTMATGTVPVIVKKGIIGSNSVNFRVIESPLAGPTPGAQNLKVLDYTPGAGERACPAMIIEVTLEGLVDRDSLPNSFAVKSESNVPLLGQVLAQEIEDGNTRLSFIPSANLQPGSNYSIVLKGGQQGLRSQSGGVLAGNGICPPKPLADNGECVIAFSAIASGDAAALAQCQIASMSVEPPENFYTCAGRDDCQGDSSSTAGHQRDFTARVEAYNGQSLHVAANKYVWTSGDEAIMNFEPSKGEAQTQSFTILPKNGLTRIGAEVTIGVKKFSAAARAEVFLCANPWPSQPQTPFKDSTNFSTFYCRDRGTASLDDDLPLLGDLKEFTSRQSVWGEDLIKEVFLTQPKSKKCQAGDKAGQACAGDSECGGVAGQCVGKTDAIGIRVLKNLEHDSIGEWYGRQAFIKGSPQAMKVDGYEALRDGRTIYVNAANDSNGAALAANTIYTNIYLISVNDGATAETQNIFEQLVQNWRFGANVSDVDNLGKLRRDTKRLADLRHLADLVETRVNSEGSPPKLESGTFTKNWSVSVWPSWSGSLASDLGAALPVDPVNAVATSTCAVRGAVPDTCWKALEPNKGFQCVADSFVYQYEYTASPAPNFTLRANLEYQPGSWFIPASGRWALINTTNSCQNVFYGVNP